MNRSSVCAALLAVGFLAAACSADDLSEITRVPASNTAGAAALAGAANGGAPAAGAPSVAVGGSGPLGPDLPSNGGSAGSVGFAGSAGNAASAGNSGSPTTLADDPGSEGDGIFSIGPAYKNAPEFQRADGVPQGKTFKFTFNASDSQIYPKAKNRVVSVYVPAQYKAGTLAAAMVFQDGTDFFGFDGSIPPVLDNLIAKGSIPPLVAVFAGNGGGDYIGSERGLEYDTVSGLYAKWVDSELFPRVEQETKTRFPEQAVTFTKNPEGRATMGGSSGGAAALSMVWWRPDLFRRAITYSGTFVNQVASGTPFKHGAWVYHDIDPWQEASPNGLVNAFCERADGTKTSSDVETCDTPLSQSTCHQVSGCAWNTSKNKPIRVWHEAGTNDLGAGDSWSSYRNFYLANQRLAKAFKARGYHFHFDDAKNAGHVDQGALKQTLPSALVWLWRGYRAGT